MLVWAVEKIQQIDMAILDFLAQNLHGGWTDGLMKFVTALGNIGFISVSYTHLVRIFVAKDR